MKTKPTPIRNYVAKYSFEINRPKRFKDKKKDYNRKLKHIGKGYSEVNEQIFQNTLFIF